MATMGVIYRFLESGDSTGWSEINLTGTEIVRTANEYRGRFNQGRLEIQFKLLKRGSWMPLRKDMCSDDMVYKIARYFVIKEIAKSNGIEFAINKVEVNRKGGMQAGELICIGDIEDADKCAVGYALVNGEPVHIISQVDRERGVATGKWEEVG